MLILLTQPVCVTLTPMSVTQEALSSNYYLDQGWHPFSLKGQIVNIFRLCRPWSMSQQFKSTTVVGQQPWIMCKLAALF